MQLSIIILNYKVPYYLLQCIASVKKSIAAVDAEIIVIDNNSEDHSCKLVKKHFPNVKLIENKTNSGFSRGNNIGIKQAQGKYICLLNPDTAVGETIFKQLISFAEKNTDFGAIGPQLIDGTGQFLPESKRNIPTPKIALQKLFGNSKNYYAPLHKDKTGKIDILVGAFMFIRKDRYWEVGGLDEDYFMYGEDIDLSYKFIKAGYSNYYIGNLTVLHYKGESTIKNTKYRKRFYGAMKIFYNKHFQKNKLVNRFVNLGLKLAEWSHPLKKTELINKRKNETIYLWVGEFTPSSEELKKETAHTITAISIEDIKEKATNQATLIFDGQQISYDIIFRLMKKYSGTNLTYRIKPPHLRYIIGSDSNTGQGNVQHL